MSKVHLKYNFKRETMNTIVVPVDFSEYSEYALKAASSIIKKTNGRIIALHMLDLQTSTFNESQSYLQERAAFLFQFAKKKFEFFLKRDYLKDIKVVPLIKYHKVFSEINEVVEEENADMIVMGSHGASGMKELFVGSNTEKVIRFSKVPVLVIKNGLGNDNFNNVVYATDFSKESVGAYIRIKSLVEELQGRLHLLYVNTPYNEFKTTEEMEELASTFLQVADSNSEKLKEVNFVCDKTVEQGIFHFANSINAEMVALSTHARKGFSHIFKGSVSEDVANHASLPILTVKI